MGRPWLFNIKGEKSKFTHKDNLFDQFKRHLLLETLICIQRKLNVMMKKERGILQQKKLLSVAMD